MSIKLWWMSFQLLAGIMKINEWGQEELLVRVVVSIGIVSLGHLVGQIKLHSAMLR